MKKKLLCIILIVTLIFALNSAAFSDDNRTLIDTVLKTSADEFNRDLALIGADLSLITYGSAEKVRNYLINNFGFESENIFDKNYDGSLAFTVATKDFSDCSLLLIMARGSKTEYELQMDAESDAQGNYKGYPVYDFINQFSREIIEGTSKVIDKNKSYKVFLCGHSLGGASANLAAAYIIDGYENEIKTSKDDIYCYTFGAIDSIKSAKPVTDGYENIHNIYNDLDTFSPSGYGFLLLNGAGSKVGKFGVLDDFYYDFRSDEEKKQADFDQIIAAVNHSILNYRTAIEQGMVDSAAEPSDWAKAEIEAAKKAGFVTKNLLKNPKAAITREDFAQLAVNFTAYNLGYGYDEFKDFVNSKTSEVLFSDTDNQYVLLAARIGIVEGVGEGKFNPKGKITREQAATMLYRTYTYYCPSADIGNELEFSDKDLISDWARNAVRFCRQYDIMQGYESGAFAPYDNYTAEQSIATFVRMGAIKN